MIMMTAKVNIKKLLIALAVIAGLIIALALTMGSGEKAETTAVTTMSDNGSRVQFLKEHGWEVTTSPTESGQVRIPKEMTPVYERYNQLQISQGFDLSRYAGKTVMRYVYQVNNFPGATEPVYATLLVYKNQIIGADITNTAAGGSVQSIQSPPQTMPTIPSSETTPPTEAATDTAAQ